MAIPNSNIQPMLPVPTANMTSISAQADAQIARIPAMTEKTSPMVTMVWILRSFPGFEG